jgi:hypothetical protein
LAASRKDGAIMNVRRAERQIALVIFFPERRKIATENKEFFMVYNRI